VKVALVTDSTAFGGAEAYLATLCRLLAQSGHEVVLVCPPELVSCPAFQQASRVSATRDFIPFRGLTNLRDVCTVFGALRAARPDVLHLNLPAPFSAKTFLVPVLARWAGVRCVTTTEHLPRMNFGLPQRLCKRIVAALIQTTIAVSNSSKRFLTAYFWLPASAVTVVHNGVNIPGSWDRAQARDELRIPESQFVILQVASLHRRKGHVTLFRALRALIGKQSATAITAVLVGSGPDQSVLQREVSSLGLGNHVRFAGHCPQPGLYYAAADVFVLPSEKEAFPLSTMEAMSYALPVVATAVDGIPEQVEDGRNGFLFEPGDADRLAGLLGQLLDDPQLRAAMGAEGRKRVIAEFTLQQSFERTLECWTRKK